MRIAVKGKRICDNIQILAYIFCGNHLIRYLVDFLAAEQLRAVLGIDREICIG